MGDIGESGRSQDVDGKVAQGSHNPWAGMGSYLGTVFIEGDVPDIMIFIFDAPMSSIEGKELFRGGLLGR